MFRTPGNHHKKKDYTNAKFSSAMASYLSELAEEKETNLRSCIAWHANHSSSPKVICYFQ